MKLIINFKELRQEQGYTQNDVHEKTGLTVATISRLENGQTKPSLETSVKYLEAIGLEFKIVEK